MPLNLWEAAYNIWEEPKHGADHYRHLLTKRRSGAVACFLIGDGLEDQYLQLSSGYVVTSAALSGLHADILTPPFRLEQINILLI